MERAEVRVSAASMEVRLPIAERVWAKAQQLKREALTLQMSLHEILAVVDGGAAPGGPSADRRAEILKFNLSMAPSDYDAVRPAVASWRGWVAALADDADAVPPE